MMATESVARTFPTGALEKMRACLCCGTPRRYRQVCRPCQQSGCGSPLHLMTHDRRMPSDTCRRCGAPKEVGRHCQPCRENRRRRRQEALTR